MKKRETKKSLEEMFDEKFKEDKYNELLKLLEKDIVNHTITLFKGAGKTITRDEAKNVIAKVGMKLILGQLKS